MAKSWYMARKPHHNTLKYSLFSKEFNPLGEHRVETLKISEKQKTLVYQRYARVFAFCHYAE
jgi:hypothetical protein